MLLGTTFNDSEVSYSQVKFRLNMIAINLLIKTTKEVGIKTNIHHYYYLM